MASEGQGLEGGSLFGNLCVYGVGSEGGSGEDATWYFPVNLDPTVVLLGK